MRWVERIRRALAIAWLGVVSGVAALALLLGTLVAQVPGLSEVIDRRYAPIALGLLAILSRPLDSLAGSPSATRRPED